MAGMFDWFGGGEGQGGGGFLSDPRQAAMLGLASGLLQAGGRSNQPVGIGQGLGMGLQSAAQLASVAQRGQLQQAQMKKLLADQQEAERRRTAWQAQLKGLTGAGAGGEAGSAAGVGRITPDMLPMLEALGPNDGPRYVLDSMKPKEAKAPFGGAETGYWQLGPDGKPTQLVPGVGKGPKVGETRKYPKGDQDVTEQWDGEKYVPLGTGPRWNPKEAPDKPPFGSGTEGQSLSIIHGLSEKIKSGTAAPHERQLYDLAFNHYTQPKMQMSADGTVIGVTPQLPPGVFDPRAKAPGPSNGAAAPAAVPPPNVSRETMPPELAPVAAPNTQVIAPGVTRTGTPNKEPPAAMMGGMLENVNSSRKIDLALQALEQVPNAIGTDIAILNAIPLRAIDRLHPRGVEARAAIADIGSLKIHDRSGAAVTISEFPRLKPFIPDVGDTYEAAQTKLRRLRQEYLDMLKDQYSTYGPSAGYRRNDAIEKYMGPGVDPPRQGGATATGGASMKQRYGLD